MRGLNQVTLIGNLGRAPEMRYTPDGKPVTTFSLAIGRKWKDEKGELKEETTWLRVVCWNGLAESCNESLDKGSPVFVQGRLATRSWQDKEGIKRTSYEIIASTVTFLGAKGEPVAEPEPDDLSF